MVFTCVNHLEGPGRPGPAQLVAKNSSVLLFGETMDDVLETQILLNSTDLHSNNHNKLHTVKKQAIISTLALG